MKFWQALVLFWLCVYLNLPQYADGKPTLSVYQVPAKAILNRPVTVTCKISEEAQVVMIIKQLSKDILQVTWPKNKPYEVQDHQNWRNKIEYQISKDPSQGLYSIKFDARYERDMTFQCLILNPFLQRSHTLLVLVPPVIKSLKVEPKTVDGKAVEDISPGDRRKVKCVVMTGSPPANIIFSAPGNGSTKFEQVKVIDPANSLKTIEYGLDRVFGVKDDKLESYCSATNEAGRSSQAYVVQVRYAPRNTELSLSRNSNISVGDKISCSSQGNPTPTIKITITSYGEKDKKWASKGANGIGMAYLYIPHTATLGKYAIACNASNNIKSEVIKATAFNVVERWDMTTASYASAGVIGGIILGLLVLVIFVAIICFVVQRRQNTAAKQERGAEVEKGPYDIDAHDYKSGSQGTYPGDRGQQTTALFRPSTGGSNGEQQFSERGDKSLDEECDPNEQPLNYASLDFDETPRSRMPIVFKDNDKVEYSEIISSPPYNNSYDEDHYYENVRHNVV